MQSSNQSMCQPDCPFDVVRCSYLSVERKCLCRDVDVKAGKVIYCPLSYEQKRWATAT